MSTRLHLPFRPVTKPRNGLVLIVVLALIALMSILIVSFIAFSKLNKSATFSYSKQIQAQEIAHGGIEDILNDLRTEMIAGSSTLNTSGGLAGTFSPVYIPNTNWTAQPARLGFASSAFGTDVSTLSGGQYLLPPTFVRESKASQDGVATDLFSTTLSATYGYTGTLPLNRATAASTTNASVNGRLVSLARWAETDLLSTNNTPSFLPGAFVTNAPDWVYVSRAGSRACIPGDLANMLPAPLNGAPTSTGTASPVVGRYAYVVYDEGALLDVNTVGYTSSATNAFTTLTNNPGATAPANSYVDSATGISQYLTTKSFTSYADLTQLPGLSGNQPIVDNLVKWRNASANLAAASGAGTNFYQAAFTYGKSGFLNFQTSKYGTDSPLLNRQDLINYFTSIDPHINTTSATYSKALPYLGTFTRTANAPSWNPTSDSQNLGINSAGAGYVGLTNPNGSSFVSSNPTTGATAFANMGYKSNAESSTDGTTDASGNQTQNANRDVPNVRWAVSGTVIHYNDDGSSYTYQVNKGDPLVQHRFSLARLSWLSAANSSTGLNITTTLAIGTFTANATPFNSSLSTTQEQNAVQDCFGLVWDGQQTGSAAVAPHLTGPHFDCWDYVATTTPDIHIFTLGEIANGITSATSTSYYREPNFFEMLKAGILSGSLGQTSGPISTGANAEGTHSLYAEAYYTEKNRHVLQIGANVIAQYGSSSIPPAIYLPIWGNSVEVTGTGSTTAAGNISILPETDLAFNTVYGDENLPGLTRVYETIIEDWYTGTDVASTGTVSVATPGSGWMKSWVIPEIWNIHQAPPGGNYTGTSTTAGSPGYPSPTQFRVHSYGTYDSFLRSNPSLPPGVSMTLAPQMNWDDTTPTGTYTYHDATSGFLGTATPMGTSSSIYEAQPASAPIMNGTVTSATSASPANVVYFMDEVSATSPFYRFPDFLQNNSTGNLYSGALFQPWNSGTHKPGGVATFPLGGPFMGTNPVCMFSTTTPGAAVVPDSDTLGDGSGTKTLIEFVGLFGGEENFGDCNTQVTGTTTVTPGGFIQYFVSPATPIYISLECQDPNTLNWHPYNWINSLSNDSNTTGSKNGGNWLYGDNANTLNTGTATPLYNNYFLTPGNPGSHAMNGQTMSANRGDCLLRADPRTDRFSVMTTRMTVNGGSQLPNCTAYGCLGAGSAAPYLFHIEDNFPTRTWGFVYNPDQGTNPAGFGASGGTYPATWALNLPTTTADYDYYVDPDGVARPGDSYREDLTSGDGCLLFHGCQGGGAVTTSGVASASTQTISTSPVSLLPTTYANTAGVNLPIGSAQVRRPVILNRPFHNVGEMGYTFRDVPFKTIDFFSQYSGDAALLDLFSVTDEPPVSSGQVNLSNAPASIMTAMLNGATKQEINPQYAGKYDNQYASGVSASTGAPNFISPTEAASIASQLATKFATAGPINNRSDLVARLDPVIGTPTGTAPSTTYTPGSLLSQGYLDYANKAVAEAPIRALSGITSTRTWNLLVDIIAQSGQMSPTAATLNDFVVQGERRYWLHVSIDRYTGKIIDEQLEPVYE